MFMFMWKKLPSEFERAIHGRCADIGSRAT
jgi:hypothetical protein